MAVAFVLPPRAFFPGERRTLLSLLCPLLTVRELTGLKVETNLSVTYYICDEIQ
jgi:hypothetical protein